MKKKYLFSLILFLGVRAITFAQPSIEYEANRLRLNDIVQKTVVDYFPAGDSGEDVLWDFRDVVSEGECYHVEFCCDSDSVFLSIDPSTLCKYDQTEDTLKLLGYETPLKFMSYESPIPLMAYPFHYGDYMETPYLGTGHYCKTLQMDNSGTLSVEADATGSIILADEDTLRNVLRIHIIKTTSVNLYHPNDTMAVRESAGNLKQEIEEHYQWYARGFRYPVYETSTLTCYDDLTLVSCVQTAYRNLPNEQILLNDSINEEIQRQDSLTMAEEIDIFPHEVSFNGNTLILRYDQLADANITALICNAQGMVYAQQSTHQPSGESYQMSFDCGGLRRGEYILYINVNGKVYNEKFQVK
ncbi:MAG: hypothetical protein IJP82_05605 [Bacteroidaceae bacterium]|nr:hypothetical protein [Bacteroidaceae bacterium]